MGASNVDTSINNIVHYGWKCISNLFEGITSSMKKTLKPVAEYLMCGVIKNHLELEEKIKGQWEYKKDKGFSDVNIAVEKGKQMGKGKTEREIQCVEMYLDTVFKKVMKIVKM